MGYWISLPLGQYVQELSLLDISVTAYYPDPKREEESEQLLHKPEKGMKKGEMQSSIPPFQLRPQEDFHLPEAFCSLGITE